MKVQLVRLRRAGIVQAAAVVVVAGLNLVVVEGAAGQVRCAGGCRYRPPPWPLASLSLTVQLLRFTVPPALCRPPPYQMLPPKSAWLPLMVQFQGSPCRDGEQSAAVPSGRLSVEGIGICRVTVRS